MFEVDYIGVAQSETTSQTGVAVLISDNDISLFGQSGDCRHACQITAGTGDTFLFVNEFAYFSFKLTENFHISSEHSRAMVSGSVILGSPDGCVLDVFVSHEIQIGVAGKGFTLEFLVDRKFLVFDVFDLPHERPGFLEVFFYIDVGSHLALALLNRQVQNRFLYQNCHVVQRLSLLLRKSYFAVQLQAFVVVTVEFAKVRLKFILIVLERDKS